MNRVQFTDLLNGAEFEMRESVTICWEIDLLNESGDQEPSYLHSGISYPK